METVLWVVLAVMFSLLVYTIVWVSIAIYKKAQPGVDSFFDVVHGFWSIRNTRARTPSTGAQQQESRPSGAANNQPKI